VGRNGARRRAGESGQGRPAGRTLRRGGESHPIVSPISADREHLERILLRRGLGALEADRTTCADCGRTPLFGELVHLYDGRRPRLVCELCRPLRREAPVATQPVRHAAHGNAVRITARAA
jgi:hypothetical protein